MSRADAAGRADDLDDLREFAKRIVNQAPPLTEAQRRRIGDLLRPLTTTRPGSAR